MERKRDGGGEPLKKGKVNEDIVGGGCGWWWVQSEGVDSARRKEDACEVTKKSAGK